VSALELPGAGGGWLFPQQVEVNVANVVKQTLLRGTKQSPSQGSQRRLRHEAIRRPLIYTIMGGAAMSIEIQEIGIELLPRYAEIPISFKVESIFRIEVINQGLGGFRLVEEKVETYIKDYDNQEEGDDDRPIRWTKRFDVSRWGFFLAVDGPRAVGGATVAIDTPEVNMLENRKDLAVLWDIRVHPDERRGGIGSKLFKHAADWARRKGCKQLKVETQNINVPGCRFYAKQGCELGAIHRYGYAGCPDIAHEAMLFWYLEL